MLFEYNDDLDSHGFMYQEQQIMSKKIKNEDNRVCRITYASSAKQVLQRLYRNIVNPITAAQEENNAFT